MRAPASSGNPLGDAGCGISPVEPLGDDSVSSTRRVITDWNNHEAVSASFGENRLLSLTVIVWKSMLFG